MKWPPSCGVWGLTSSRSRTLPIIKKEEKAGTPKGPRQFNVVHATTTHFIVLVLTSGNGQPR